MIRTATVRAVALALPDVEETDHDGHAAFACYGARIATLFQEERRITVALSAPDQAALRAEHPDAISPVPGRFGEMGHTFLDLAKADGPLLERALFLAWKKRSDMKGRARRG